MPNRGTFPRVCKAPRMVHKKETENLVNRKGLTDTTLQRVSGRIRGGPLRIGPLCAGVAGPGAATPLSPALPCPPHTHRNCMATTPTSPSVSAPSFSSWLPGGERGAGGELGPAWGAGRGLRVPGLAGGGSWRTVWSASLPASQGPPGAKVDPPMPSTELYLALVS